MALPGRGVGGGGGGTVDVGLCNFPVDWSEFQKWNIWKTGPRSFISTKFGEIMGFPPMVLRYYGGDP